MRQNVLTWLVGILIVTLIAGFIGTKPDTFNETGKCTNVIGVGDLNREICTRLGLDLRGGLQLVLQAVPQAGQVIDAGQLEATRNIIESRANGTGAAEPVVQTAEGNRILVELPGLTDLETATSIIKETAFLEFINSGSTPLNRDSFVCTRGKDAQGKDVVNCPSAEQLRSGSPTPSPVATSAVSTTVQSTTPVTGTAAVTGTQTITGTGTTTTTTAPAATTPQTTPSPEATPALQTYDVVVTGDEIDGNKVSVAFDTNNVPRVTFTMKGDGSRKLADFTSANIGKYMPIVLDKKVISSPQIQGAIVGGNGEITGVTLSEAQKLAVQLKYGALPVGLKLLETRKISATLGQEAIDRSFVAGIIGLGLVVLFMLVYYRLPGALADVALLIYAIVTYAIFKFVPVTLTLAGIAGFILSIGMAVDANVLIFARLKEELRSGKTLAAAVEAGFDHAWPSIRDSNISTLITCGILFWFGSAFGGASIIKGFALTLGIGVLVSLFTAILVSRTFLRAIVRTGLAQNKWAFGMDPMKSTATPAMEIES